jgi:hypothetical protein
MKWPLAEELAAYEKLQPAAEKYAAREMTDEAQFHRALAAFRDKLRQPTAGDINFQRIERLASGGAMPHGV